MVNNEDAVFGVDKVSQEMVVFLDIEKVVIFEPGLDKVESGETVFFGVMSGCLYFSLSCWIKLYIKNFIGKIFKLHFGSILPLEEDGGINNFGMIKLHGIEIILKGVANQNGILSDMLWEEGMQGVRDGVGDGVEDWFGDTAEFSVVVEYGIGWFKELVKDDFLFVVDDGASGEFKTNTGGDHLAVNDQN